jgi:hypothetical protein
MTRHSSLVWILLHSSPARPSSFFDLLAQAVPCQETVPPSSILLSFYKLLAHAVPCEENFLQTGADEQNLQR